jgi:hypothetical protein
MIVILPGRVTRRFDASSNSERAGCFWMRYSASNIAKVRKKFSASFLHRRRDNVSPVVG